MATIRTISSSGEATAGRPTFGASGLLQRFVEPAAGYGVPFLLITYLGMQGGGYDAVVRSEIGIVAWWVLLMGLFVAAWPRKRVPGLAWAAFGLLGAYAVWTAVGISWSESSERATTETARVASLLGVFAAFTFARGRDSLRRTVLGVAAGIAFIGCVALASRLQPHWFPSDVTAETLGAARSRLNYPLDYWNGLATLLAMGIPLLLVGAARVRHVVLSALLAGIVPALVLAVFYTFSRGGAAETGLALAALFLVYPRRLTLLAAVTPAAIGSALLIVAATQRDALENGLSGFVAQQQGDEMTALAVLVCGGVGLLNAAIALARRHGVGPRLHLSRRAAQVAACLLVLLLATGALTAGAPSAISERWSEFKQSPEPSLTDASRFEAAGGGGRYQLWGTALDAFKSDPLKGIGAGTYEFWKARTSEYPAFVRDAHSLYLEALAELGLVGGALIASFVGLILVAGARRALRGSDLERRSYTSAAVAATLAFAAAAAVDWAWELTVLPVVFLVLAAGILSTGPTEGSTRSPINEEGASKPVRLALTVVAVSAMTGIAIPLATTTSLRDSQAEARAGEITTALDRAERANSIQPYAASPAAQKALLLEQEGALSKAVIAARQATENEPTNWRNWLVKSRIEAHLGEVGASIASYRKARSLNPHSPLFR